MGDTSYFERFSRNIGILSREDQRRLKDASVAVAGVGGVGGMIVERLTRCGVGHLKIADPEEFEITDINRQIVSSTSSTGSKKVDALQSHLLDINPDLELTVWDSPIDGDNADSFVQGMDLVINEIDASSLSCILALCLAAKRKNITVIQGAVKDFSAGVFLYSPDGISPDFFLNILCPVYSNDTSGARPAIAPACSLAGSIVSSEAVLNLLGRPSMPSVPKFTMVYLDPPLTRVIDLSDAIGDWVAVCSDFYLHGTISKSAIDRLRSDLRLMIEKSD